MAAVPMVYTQLVPPHIKHSIKRCALRNTGLAILSHRVTTVVAPAGYGKSIWVANLLEESNWPATAWLSLDSYDIKPSYLLYHLIYAVQRILPDFGLSSLRTMNSLEDAGRDWLTGVSAFIEEIPREEEMVLVIDDFHLIDKGEVVCSVLDHLIRWLPARVHLVLLSRSSIPLNLNRLRMNDELLEIQGSQLLFSASETRELFSQLGLELADEDVNLIHTSTEGWAAGLRLLAILLRQAGGSVDQTLAGLKRLDADLYTYLGNELLAFLPKELHSFMLDASLLPYLDPDLSDNALARNDSADIIARLHAHGIFSRSEGEIVTWRMHHLMGEFLKHEVVRVRHPDYISKIRHRLAAFLESRGDIDRALEQLAYSCDWNAMAGLIVTYGDSYFLQSGRLDALKSWLERLPAALINREPWLLYFRGMSILHSHPGEALATLSCATDTARGRGDLKCQLRSLFLMIAAYTFANNLEKVKETARRIPVVASLFKSPWSRGVVLVAGLSRTVWEDNLRKGVRLSWLAGKTKLDPESQMSYLMFSSMIQFRLGNLNTARELIEKALVYPYVRENEQWLGTVNAIHSFICMLSGELEKMEQVCQELLRVGKKYSSPHQLGVAHRRLAHLFKHKGSFKQARQEFDMSREAFVQANNEFMVHLTDLDLIMLRIEAGAAAGDLLFESELLMNKLRTTPAGQGFDDYALSIAGIIAMEAGQLAKARQLFEEVILKCKQKGARQVLAGTRLLLARVHLLAGKETISDTYLHQALGAAEEEKWEYFWDWHAESVYCMCQRSLLKNIRPYWGAYLLSRWFPELIVKEANSLLTHPDERVQSCIAGLLQDLAGDGSGPFIHVNCFGKFEVFVNGAKINPSQWKNRKTENLFKLVIICKRQQLKETIIEKLWPESEPRLGDASLRMAISYVRQALGIGDEAGASLILKRGMIYINPRIMVFTDYELFLTKSQNALQEAEEGSPLATHLLDQAAALYRGDFLPDNIYDDWAGELRVCLKELYLRILSKLIEIDRDKNRISHAIEVCRKYLAIDPYDERICRTAMELLWQNGQKQKALSLYRKLKAALQEEYNTNPSLETTALYQIITGE